MKSFCFIVILVVGVWSSSAEEKYGTDHDKFDIVALVEDFEKLKAMNDCLTGANVCDAPGAHFKKYYKEATREGCAKCNPAQVFLLMTYLTALKEKLPEEYQKISQELDPEGKVIPTFLAKA